ncbi:hypothetical protein [Fusobacterium sp. FSA-380-WT-2B]|uniref:hypothetical protein n=1 Tax=Fusobacterium sp. FSA-380-WT-2B TaxID=2605786 RepID=UPI0012B1C14F|nr:hypothetical protein [Fusobacterium sp. FSA-380-WT-2B]MSS61444.1 hypothetical protein [Fusobacterium sp. FSA-380-WT-2B]
MKLIVYFLIIIVSLLIIIMDIFKFFLAFFKILGYFFIFGIIFTYLADKTQTKALVAFTTSSIFCFVIFYGYFAIMDFLVGVKVGLIQSLEKNQ